MSGLERRKGLRPQSKKARKRARVQAKIREIVFERDGWRCRLADVTAVYVGGELVQVPACFGRLTPHHVVKKSQGGRDVEGNEVTLCAGHNDWVEDNPAAARELGLVERVPCPDEVES